MTQLAFHSRAARVVPAPLLLLAITYPGDVHGQEPALEVSLAEPNWVAPQKFTAVVSVRETTAGVIVADRAEARLIFFGWDGAEELEIGREGQGPSEFRSVGRLYPLAGDSTLMLDYREGRWNLLDGHRIVRTLGPQRPLTGVLRTEVYGADAYGHVLGTRGFRFFNRGGPTPPDSLVVLVGDRAMQSVDTVARVKGVGSGGTVRLPARPGQFPRLFSNNPLAAGDQALLFPDGWVALVYVEGYRVDWLRPDGTWVRGSPLPFETVSVDRTQKCAVLAQFFREEPCDPGILSDWPETLPPFLPNVRLPGLFAGTAGRLVIARMRIDGDSGHRYDVIDRAGRMIGVVRLPPNEHIVGSGQGALYTVVTDDLDLQTLRRRPVLGWTSANCSKGVGSEHKGD